MSKRLEAWLVIVIFAGLFPHIAGAATDTVLHSFGSTAEGASPVVGLPAISGTVLYSTTASGGTKNKGVIYKVNLDGSGYKVLHDFGSIPDDGTQPHPGVLLVGGTLYGPTDDGGTKGDGTLFEINTDGAGYQVIYNFGTVAHDGNNPNGLTLVGSSIYGTAPGGANGGGILFSIGLDGSNYTILYNFGAYDDDAVNPAGYPVLSGTTLYNNAGDGGDYGYGAIYKINIDGSGERVLYSYGTLDYDALSPTGPLILSGTTLYGATFQGGSIGYGAMFSMNINGSDYRILHNFGATALDGLAPNTSPAISGTTLYCTTEAGGDYKRGTVFRINLDGSGYSTIYSFGSRVNDGVAPDRVALAGSTLYGSTVYGGAFGRGTIFGYPLAGLDADIGRYTLLLEASGTGAGIPQGDGYATMTVNAKGNAIIAGKLPDGESLSDSDAKVSGTAENLLGIDESLSYAHTSVVHAKGLLSGTLTFAAVPGSSDVTGTLEWTKPEQTKGAYPGAIDTELNVIGSFYTPPPPSYSILPGFTTGRLELSDTGTLSASGSGTLTKDVTLTSRNQLSITNPGADKLKITITPATGVFKGSFLYPGDKTPVEFNGALFQDQVNGGGFFLGPDGSGMVILSP